MSTALVISIVAACAVTVWVGERIVRRRVLRRFESRPTRTAEIFGRDFFPQESAPIAARIREILARHLSVDLSRLSPEDTFVDLEVAELDSLATVGFVTELEQEFNISISDRDIAKLKTFRDVVEYVSKAKAKP